VPATGFARVTADFTKDCYMQSIAVVKARCVRCIERIPDVSVTADCSVRTVASAVETSSTAQRTSSEEDGDYVWLMLTQLEFLLRIYF